jgi:uncharacterized protein (TIGR00730 family)
MLNTKIGERPEKNATHAMRKDIHEGSIAEHLDRINREFKDGFEFIKNYPKSVTVFGSARIKPETTEYAAIVGLTAKISKELGYAVITGGGPGIMEAANKGSFEAGGKSVGLNIALPHESGANSYLSDHMKFTYFFSRKTILTFAAEAYIFCPGGYGTFDELFSILTLIQTGKIPRVPIILYQSEFWTPLSVFLESIMSQKYQTIAPDDTKLFEITDSPDRAIEIIRNAQVFEWWRSIN